MTADQVGVHRLDGVLVDAPLKPSSEFPLHLAAYRNTGGSAIVQTYGVVSTAISTVVDEIPPSHYYTGPFGGIARVARCASFGTDDLAHNVVTAGIRRLRVDTVVMSTSAVIDYVTYHPRRKPTC